MAQQLIFDLRALLRESYPCISAFDPAHCGNALLQILLKPVVHYPARGSSRLPDSLIDLEVYENPLASNPTGSNPWLCGKSRGKQPWGTPVKVKLLRPPRQSRGNS